MSIQNDSDVPSELLAAIDRIVRKYSPLSKHASLAVTSTGDSYAESLNVITGDTKRLGGWLRGHQQRHHIVMFVPRAVIEKQYPDTLCIEGVETEFLSWDEEFAMVLAHEYRHVWQYETGNYANDMRDHADELDAELFAADFLVKHYRPWRNRYFTRIAARIQPRQE